jgi:hypothetical protein
MTSSAAATAPTGERRTIVNFGGNIRWAPLVYQPANDQEVPTTRRSCRSCANTPGRDGFEGIGTPARSPGAPATREEAHGTPSARPRPASKLGIHVDARASARQTRQDQDPASRGSCPCVCAVAGVLRFLRWSPSRFSMPGDACSTRVRLTIGRPVRTRRPIDCPRPRSGRSRTW